MTVSPLSPPDALAMAIAGRLAEIRRRIELAARGAGRTPDAVRLVAVSKTFDVAYVRAAAAAGQVDFGENRVQEALQKIDQSSDLQIRWHLVGHLQSNKARRAATAFAMIHSLDSLDLLTQIDRAAEEAGAAPELLVQVDLAGEATKHGAPVSAVRPLFEAGGRCRAARVVGLMVLPPLGAAPEVSRPWFRRLRDLRDGLAAEGTPPSMLRELSMGMSGDFEVAVQEGATLVRVGTAIFGTRHHV
ncbi:MAG TPA: YggS family pyridoxal phosphate-dependent enzyme [Vicinamibacterales bacterium]|nr:YggS family pyridoxal phosphate-dependent enzyme [Vicinamibacterales bacterium]